MKSWFEVDKKGLSKLMESRPKAFLLYELLANAWDQRVTKVDVTIRRTVGTRYGVITVEDDDPEGFADLTHAYTLFAESAKKANPEQRGRFNLGEKLVLALAHSATIATTKGTVTFVGRGRHITRDARDIGSKVTLEIPMTTDDARELVEAASRLIPPFGLHTFVNGEKLPERPIIACFEADLPTLIADSEGILRKSVRKTAVRVYEPLPDEPATIYEMGIPVVPTRDKYHVNIHQKVPLTVDRENVPPSYLQTVRVAVLNATHAYITDEEVNETWVKAACSDERASPTAVASTLGKKFGENAVAYDPTDPEANKIAVSEGRQVVYGGHLSAGEWQNARAAGILPAAGKVTPSPKPYAEGGKPLTLIPPGQWTSKQLAVAAFAGRAALFILDRQIVVEIAREPTWPFSATYGNGQLVLNLGRLGHKFFDNCHSEEVLDLLIHELAHEWASDHLSREYFAALSKAGARMALFMFEQATEDTTQRGSVAHRGS